VRSHGDTDSGPVNGRSRALILALLLLGPSLAGCGSEQGYHGFNFVNQTGVRVDVRQVLPNGTEIGVVSLDAGLEHSILGYPGLSSSGGTCAYKSLVALDAQRFVVARREGIFCMDGEWRIGARQAPPSPYIPVLLLITAIAVALALVLVARAWRRASA
jgi:hypothetical protein